MGLKHSLNKILQIRASRFLRKHLYSKHLQTLNPKPNTVKAVTSCYYSTNVGTAVILGVSASWGRGSDKLNDAILLSRIIPEEMQMVLVGREKEPGSIPQNIKHISYIDGPQKLAELYSMADAYVHFSAEDAFGKVIAEAMSCGMPAIVYNSTACPELVGESCGYVVEKRNVEEVYSKLCKIRINGEKYYTARCIKYVRDNFGMKQNIAKTLKLYKSVSGL